MARPLVYVGILTIAAAIGFGNLYWRAAEHPQQQTAGVRIGGPFSMVDHNGKPVSEADYKGRFRLMFFGYTYCPDVCPTTLQTIAEAMDLLGGQADRVAPLFVTVDPERDTPAVLKSYVEHFHRRLTGLTGSAAQAAAMAKTFAIYFKKVLPEGAAPEDYLMDHSAAIYLMGPDGRFVSHFSRDTEARAMADKIRKQL